MDTDIVYVYVVDTEASDRYTYTYKEPQERDVIVQRVYEEENAADLQFYKDTLRIEGFKCEFK